MPKDDDNVGAEVRAKMVIARAIDVTLFSENISYFPLLSKKMASTYRTKEIIRPV